MKKRIDRRRREFLKYAGVAGLATTGLLPLGVSAQFPPNRASPGFRPDLEIELTARPAYVPLLAGPNSNVWKYYAEVLKGPKDCVEPMPSGYLGPIFRFRTGQKVRIRFINKLPAACITHWHGLHVPQRMDGHPMYAIGPGETYVYEFEVRNRAAMHWYHAHTHGVTAKQVYSGLAGLILVSDEQEAALGLPSGAQDVPLVIQDRSFDERNQLRYIGHMRERMMGFLGERILVNGRPDFRLEVASRPYRLRLLNGSNSRIYKLAWSDGTPLTAIATDGGLLPEPETRPYLMLAPAERIELWVDFTGRTVGTELVLKSLPYSGVMPPMYEHMGAHGGMGGGRGGMGGHGGMGGGRGMMGRRHGMMGGSAIPQGSEFTVLTVRVTRKETAPAPLPSRLAPFERHELQAVANPGQPIPIALAMRHMRFTLNGRSFESTSVIDQEKVALGSRQWIRLFHEHGGGMMGGGMMMSMAHPIHLHGQQFQVLERTAPSHHSGYDSVRDGFIDSGLKDTVLVMPGEEISVIKPFQDYTGLFLYHCHNLEHEDMDMMRNFLVG